MLEGGEDFTGAAGFEVVFGQLQAVVVVFHKLETVNSFGIDGIGKEITVALEAPPPYSAAKLVKLGQAEAVGGLNDDGSSIFDIDTDFDNRSGDKNVDFFIEKIGNNLMTNIWF